VLESILVNVIFLDNQNLFIQTELEVQENETFKLIHLVNEIKKKKIDSNYIKEKMNYLTEQLSNKLFII
jgi:hypothetical protein